MFEDEITIFNKTYNSRLKDDVYNKTYLSGVNVDLKKAVNVIKSGLQDADSGTIIIPEEVDSRNKEYVKPKQFQNLCTKSNNKRVWTLQVGDIIVLDLISYDIGGKNTIVKLRQQYDDVYEITSVDTKLKGGLPHWEVGVK